MKKKIFCLCFLFICLFFSLSNINADSYDCAYDVTFGDRKYTFTITFDPEQKTTKYSNICWNNGWTCLSGSTSGLDDTLIKYDNTLSETKDELLKQKDQNLYSGKCDSTLLVFRYWSNSANHYYFEILFNDTLEANAIEYMDSNFTSSTYKELSNEWAEFDSLKSTAPGSDISYDCDQYTSLFEKLKVSAEEIKNCTVDNNCAAQYSEYDKLKQKIKDFCIVQYQHLDYGKSCLNVCLNAQSEIEGLGVEDSSNDKICGFSEKLIIYIANIVKWGKYLVPVIVIVLGILDFIKAISADKDDEMKKAQGRFVKRLIAAALIFILPFIIEFVLDKMGFGANGCGIIDL